MTRVFLFAAAALAATPAVAGTVPAGYEPVRVEVNYRLSDVTTADGRAALNARVKAAVDTVCPSADIRDLSARRAAAKCRKQAIASVDTQMAALDARLADRSVLTAAR